MSLSVALLLSDISEVKEISSVFRKLNIVPHYYEDLATFWTGVLEKTPALCIVDVKNMSDGKLILKDHPLVKADELPLLFYYTELTEPLLFSTYDLFNLGTLKKTTSYEGPLKSVLKRVNRVMTLERANLNFKVEKNSLNEKIEELVNRNNFLLKEDCYKTMASEIMLSLEDKRGEADFFNSLEKVLTEIKEISEFGLVELSFNGQKLISPISHSNKFRPFPSLWLGQTCLEGIEVFAQNMATQVAIDLMGNQLVTLLIKGQKTKPDKLIFIKSENELFFNSFDWNLLEAFLSGLYASYELKLNRKPSEENYFANTFSAMSFLDQYVFGKNVITTINNKQNLDYRLINVDLTSLIETVHKKGTNQFLWNKFHQEFIGKLEIQTRTNFKVFSYGLQCLSFLVEAKNLNYFFDELKEFSQKFFYWKYFENSEGVLALDIKPKVVMVPLSSYAYIKAARSEHAESEIITREEAQRRTKAIIWGRDLN